MPPVTCLLAVSGAGLHGRVLQGSAVRTFATHGQVQSSNLGRHAAGRIVDCKAKVVLTASGVLRGAKHIDLKAIVDDAIGQCTQEVRAAAGQVQYTCTERGGGTGCSTACLLTIDSCVDPPPTPPHSTPLHSTPSPTHPPTHPPTALQGHNVSSCLVYDNAHARPRAECPFTQGRDIWWQDTVAKQAKECPVEWVEAEHPLFLLYTSGSTGEWWRSAC
jgi:acyl-coenzyme A synthetase/AMP-(fatty) acid ligase